MSTRQVPSFNVFLPVVRMVRVVDRPLEVSVVLAVALSVAVVVSGLQ